MRSIWPRTCSYPAIAARRRSRARDSSRRRSEPGIASLADIAALADRNRDLAFKVLVKRCVRPVKIEPGRLEVSLTDDAPKTLLGDITSRLQQWTGRRWIVSLSRERGDDTMAEKEANRRESAILDARADPEVAAILARFPGARIIDVRIPDAVVDDDPMVEPAPDADEDDS
jgi:DNA polymerase-3 subunit gamma/tau